MLKSHPQDQRRRHQPVKSQVSGEPGGQQFAGLEPVGLRGASNDVPVDDGTVRVLEPRHDRDHREQNYRERLEHRPVRGRGENQREQRSKGKEEGREGPEIVKRTRPGDISDVVPQLLVARHHDPEDHGEQKRRGADRRAFYHHELASPRAWGSG
ncbi:MAG: hypothetical protein M5U09_19550 [Gammaproteobacteria bacterium]|nr:hypothetical protein [Gammaproteobacteria bacterium]